MNTNTYFDIATNEIQLPLPPVGDITLTTGALANPAGLDIDVGIPQYFSNHSFTVNAKGTAGTGFTAAGASGKFVTPAAVDFIITVDGSASVACGGLVVTNCAIKGGEISAYKMEMDNSGRIFVSYDNGTTWGAY